MSRDRVDAAFVRFQRSGSPQDLAEVFDATAAELLRVAVHLVGDPHAAEDALQATFVAAIESAERYDGARPVVAWLQGILANQAKKHRERALRAPDPRRLTPAPLAGPAAGAERHELSRAVDDAIARMPEPYQPVLRLHLRHGLPAPEIALALGRAPDTVRKQIARGLQRLRGLLPAGLASMLAGWLLPARGLAQVRAEVLGAAARAAAVAGAAGAVPLGVLAMKKTLFAFAALVGAVLVWFAWPVQSVPGTGQTDPGVAEPVGAAVPASAEQADELGDPGDEPVRTAVAGNAEDGATLLVRVRWSDGSPAEDVGVRLWAQYMNERIARTDADGEVRFEGLGPGTVPVKLDRDIPSRRVEVRSGEVSAVEMEVPEGIDVTGVVRDSEGRSVAGARIWLSAGHTQTHGSFVTESDATGRFRIRDAGAAQLISAAAEGYLACPLVEIRQGHVELTLKGPAGAADGVVLDENGQPFHGASVMAGWVQMGGGTYFGSNLLMGTPPQYRRTDSEGRFHLSGLRLDAPTPVWACAPGYALTQAEVTGDGGAPVVLRLSCGPCVTGVVQDESGRRLSGATIGIDMWQKTGPGPYWWLAWMARAADDGSYRLENLLPGEWQIRAEADSYSRAQQTMVLTEGSRSAWNPVLRRVPSIRGTVVDRDGQPLAGLPVDARSHSDDGHSLRTVKTDATGRFELLGCESERYAVRVYEAEDWGRFAIATQPDVDAGADVRIRVEDAARGTASITGTLLRQDGAPIAHADLWVWREPYSGGPRRTTDAEGRFTASHLPPANYKLQARIPDHPLLELGIYAVAPGEQRDLGELIVASPGAVEVEVFRADGSAAQGGWITLRHADGSLAQGFRLQEGATRSRPQEPGNYSLHAWGEGVPITVRELTVRTGETTHVRIDLPTFVQRTVTFVKPGAHPEIEVDISWYGRDGKLLADGTSGRWLKGMAAEITRAFTPGTYRVLAVDDKRGLRGERTFAIAPGDPPEGRVEVVLK